MLHRMGEAVLLDGDLAYAVETFELALTNPLVKAFKVKYPDVTVEYNDLNSTELYNRFIAEIAAGSGTIPISM